MLLRVATVVALTKYVLYKIAAVIFLTKMLLMKGGVRTFKLLHNGLISLHPFSNGMQCSHLLSEVCAVPEFILNARFGCLQSFLKVLIISLLPVDPQFRDVNAQAEYNGPCSTSTEVKVDREKVYFFSDPPELVERIWVCPE